MIEAPEALLLSGQLNKTVKGRTVTEVIAGHTPHKFTWFHGDPAGYPDKIYGKVVGETYPRGGMIEMHIGDMTLLLAEGINMTYFPPGADLPAKHQLLLGFDDESCITVSVRMYGGIMCFPDGCLDGNFAPYYTTACEKPQVMSDDFTEDYFMPLAGKAREEKKSAKAFLATHQAIPGLGNGVLQDILYNAGVHPKTKITSLDESAPGKIFRSIKTTLGQMYSSGGRSTETDLWGKPGGYRPFLSKDTLGAECTRCGSTIMKENYMGGAIYFCPGCQPLLK